MAGKLIHEILPVGWLQCNCHVVGDPKSREAIVIDPGDEIDRILAIPAKYGFKVRAIVSTHAHIDHVGGLAALQKATGAPVLMHPDDLELYNRLAVQAQWLGMSAPEMTEVDGFVRDGDTVRWGGYAARVLHTPGHSRGSISLYLPFDSELDEGEEARPSSSTLARGGERKPNRGQAPRLFAGDTLFAGSIGRTDLWGGSFDQILRSIHSKLFALPEETLVYPGHGPATTMGKEKQTNPFLQGIL
jgi:glyoxylase-like metal-dependent hydrolase (beta-lactamase superfamily II)